MPRKAATFESGSLASRLISCGPGVGKKFGDIDAAALKKAAKRHPDPVFKKFAKVAVAHEELLHAADPKACVPIAHPAGSVASQQDNVVNSKGAHWTARGKAFVTDVCAAFWARKLFRRSLFLLVMLCILRPAFSTLLTKLGMNLLRVFLRRLISLLVSLLDTMIDELIYQVEFAVRDSLPSQAPAGSCAQHWSPGAVGFTHVLSVVTGAVISSISRRLTSGQRLG